MIRSERGMALAVSLGIVIMLTIALTAVVEYTSANSRSSSDSNQRTLAYDRTEAGLNDALAQLYNSSCYRCQSSMPTSASPHTKSFSDGSSYSFYGTYDDPHSTWTVSATGKAPNKTNGSKPDTKSLTQKVVVGSASTQGSNQAIWNYIYSDVPPGGGCMTLANNSTIAVPMYVRGDLCLNNNVIITGSPLQVGGTLTLLNNASVGTSSTPIALARIAGGCTGGSPSPHTCSAADRVYASTYQTTTQGLVKPTIDLAGWYSDSYPGPKHNCTSGSFPGGFDNDGAQNASLPTAVNLTPASAYDCKVTDGAGDVIGRVAWTPGSPGTLSVAGTIFWDGDLNFSTTAVYQGRAVFYFAGKVLFANGASLCGVAACDSTWNSAQNLLVVVAGSNLQSPSFAFDLQNGSIFQGASETNGDFNENNNSGVWGSTIAHQVFLANNAANYYVPFGTPLPGQPGTGVATDSLQNASQGFTG